MPKIIVTSRYLKSSSKKKLSNYVKYIATREGVAHTVAERENYVGYLANRPGAVKFDSHGLFSQTDEPIVLDRVAKAVANHKGNVWTHVVSLRRDDAQKMGYESLDAWRNLIIRQMPNIAKQSKIDMKNIRWYAAFHDKETNPHVHIIVYSTDEREGFLTNHGIEKIRSGFANDIYSDELHHIYEQQTDLRNLLKKESEQLMKQFAEKIYQNKNFDAELMNLVAKLHTQLSESKGKKVYGYLKSDVKKTVDEIFLRLADNDSIKKMYELWCEMEQQKHDVYSSAKIDFPALTDNEEFRSVKNMIIQTVVEMEYPVAEMTNLSEIADEIVLDSEQQFNETVQTETASEIPQQSVILITKDEGNPDINENFENEILANTIFSLFVNLSRCIEDDYHHKFQSGRKMIDSKLLRMMQQKKQALGMKNEHEQNQEQSY
ncbi:MAG: MobP3 family relaxase [Porcipelethomonas sp.]